MTSFREAFPILYVDDVEEAVAFYRSVFGFAETFRIAGAPAARLRDAAAPDAPSPAH